jgi:predicted lipoprotein with Yx(FWY)xxD motif
LSNSALPQPKPHPIRTAAVAVAVLALLAVLAPGAGAAGSTRVAKQAGNAALGEKILTTLKGRTLYSLSVETHGRFVCTGSCLSTWHPLTVAARKSPRGPVKLGTVKRPDGRVQVTYRGRPLYSFAGDAKAGDANGEGIRDVGTWHAAMISNLSPPAPTPAPSPYSAPAPYTTPAPGSESAPASPPMPSPSPTPESPYEY